MRNNHWIIFTVSGGPTVCHTRQWILYVCYPLMIFSISTKWIEITWPSFYAWGSWGLGEAEPLVQSHTLGLPVTKPWHCTPRTVWGRQGSCLSPQLAVSVPGGARWASWSYNFRTNNIVGGEGGKCWVHFNFSKYSSVGKTPSHPHQPHAFWTPSTLSPVLTVNAMIVNASAYYRDINRETKKAPIQTSLDTFFKRPGPSKPSPKALLNSKKASKIIVNKMFTVYYG